MKVIDLFSSRQQRLAKGAKVVHEVLQNSPLKDRFWIFKGALLGWAREGRLLEHEYDIDYCYWEEDREKFLEGSEMLKHAGFRPEHCWRNTKNHITQYSYKYKHVRIEFHEASKVNGNTRWFGYGFHGPRGSDGVLLLCETPGQELNEFEFLGKRWLKPKNHDVYLTAHYGDWKSPNPNYKSLRDNKAIIKRTPMAGKTTHPLPVVCQS